MGKQAKEKVTISVDPASLDWLDGLVQAERYESRSAAVEAAIEALRRRHLDRRLSAALEAVTDEDVIEQQALAEEGMGDWGAMVLRETEW